MHQRKKFGYYLAITAIVVSISLGVSTLPMMPKAYAHAYVIGSDPFPTQSLPTAPSKVDVHLSEPVDIRYSSVKVLDPSGNQIDKKDDHFVNGDPTTLSVTLPQGLKKEYTPFQQKCLLQLTVKLQKIRRTQVLNSV